MTNARRPACALLVLLALASTARAQGAEAEALFREGRELMALGDLPGACAKFDASERLESTVGTLLNLADCRERTGRLAAAWSLFVRAEAAARRNGDRLRQQEAARRARAIEPRLAYLTISVPAANQVDGLIIERDGAAVDPALWNVAVPLEAGTYEIAARAPGAQPWSKAVSLDESQRISVDVPGFIPVGALVSPFPAERPRPVRARTSRRDELPLRESSSDGLTAPLPPRRMTTLRWAAVGSGTAGLAGLAVGLARGLAARDLQASSDALCPDEVCDDPDGLALNRDAQRAARQSNIFLISGGVLTAGAAVLWVVGAPKRPAAHAVTVAPVAGDRTVGLTLSGSF